MKDNKSNGRKDNGEKKGKKKEEGEKRSWWGMSSQPTSSESLLYALLCL